MSAASESLSLEQQGHSLYAALARTSTRAVALYFSRPVRLFRPSKVNGWQSLRSLAAQHGQSLSAEFIQQLVKKQGFIVIPRAFIPPIIVNAALGTILWETYAMTSSALEPSLDSHSYPTITAALSGAVAGGMQALIAAPAENVRRALTGSGWVGAWKDVFRRVPGSPTDSHSQRENVRQLRNWMAEVRGMAGRGWDGWGWGCAKDMLGFATFFAIFDVTRRLATKTKLASQDVVETWTLEETQTRSLKRHLPRTVHGITLVSGGVVAGLAYELVNRPFDAARKAVQQHGVIDASNSPVQAVLLKFRQDGLGSFFRNLDKTEASPGSATSRRLHAALRTLARVGPWGVGFLVWEAFGPGLA